MGFVQNDGLPCPTMLQALTRYSYVSPSFNPSTVYFRSSIFSFVTLVNLSFPMSRLSKTYMVISEPPLYFGGFQVSVTESLVTAFTSRSSGLSGTARNKHIQQIKHTFLSLFLLQSMQLGDKATYWLDLLLGALLLSLQRGPCQWYSPVQCGRSMLCPQSAPAPWHFVWWLCKTLVSKLCDLLHAFQ